MKTQYPLDLIPEEGGQYTVTSPDLDEVVTFGDSLVEAVSQGTDAVIEALDYRITNNQPVPEPSSADGRPVATLPLQAATKVLVYRAMLTADVTKSELARRLGRDPAQVRRILDLRNNTAMPAIERALAAVGYRSVVTAVPLGDPAPLTNNLPGEVAA